MESWVRYSVAAYLGLMLAGTLIVPGPTPAAQFSSVPQASESNPSYWRPTAPCHPVATPPTDKDAESQTKSRNRKMTSQAIFISHAA